MAVVTLSKSELEYLLGDQRAINGLSKLDLDAKFRQALRQENQKLPPAWRTEVHAKIARGEHKIFAPEVAKGSGATLKKPRTKAQQAAFDKFHSTEGTAGASALTSDDLLSLMDL